MNSREIRSRYLEYFQRQGHTIVPSDTLVPKNDPTLLFTSAGMVQFKDHFLGRIKLDYTRAATCQKCLRTSDIENVGLTARHHTFFEMLGNFSFGDYFKQDAIRWAWGFITEELHLPVEKLYATVYTDDDEAIKIWQSETGVQKDHIIRLGEDSNFWNMGDTGPCGPCSEILIDQGEEFACGRPDCAPGCSCDRYLEIWNLVFTQFDRQADGSLKPLPRKNIDTGAGLERIASVMQKKKSNFETDLLQPLLDYTASLTSHGYWDSKKITSSYRVIADHCRALTFTFCDGVIPSNEGRGYVVRRILRRAYRHGRLLGIEKPFLHQAADIVIEQMKDVYPELYERRQHILQTILMEENRFESTLHSGLSLLQEAIESAKSKKQDFIPSETVFKLYDTYGFPADLTQEILTEEGLKFNQKEFQEETVRQQERSRSAWTGSGEKGTDEIFKAAQKQFGDTEFTGYQTTQDESVILGIIKDKQLVDSATAGDKVEIIVKKTPFYAESGGQVGDKGLIQKGDSTSIEITDTRKFVSHSIVHIGLIKKGTLKVGDTVQLNVNSELRLDTARNHTATHLLMGTLRKVLGDHVEQAGSLVDPERLRFDFTHYQSLTDDETNQIESIINEQIRHNLPVESIETNMNNAREMGALAFFGEKYGDQVRVVSVGDFDRELCGGTHLKAAGSIGLFLITGISSVAAGVRRIEAVTGRLAYETITQWNLTLKDMAEKSKVDIHSLPAKLDKLMEENHQLQKSLDKLKTQGSLSKIETLQDTAVNVSGVKLIVHT